MSAFAEYVPPFTGSNGALPESGSILVIFATLGDT
jgi:hypothetical protein